MSTSRIRPHHHTTRRRRRSPLLRAASTTACALTVALTAATVGIGTATADPATSTGCPHWTAVLVPGTGETGPTADPASPVGLLRPIGDGLQARYHADIAVRYLPYAASAAGYKDSESGGVQSLSSLLSGLCSSTQVLLAGYSQGADVAGDEASLIGHAQGALPDSRILAVGLISDPQRDPGTQQLGDPVSGQGMAGPRTQDFGTLAAKVRTVCTRGDLYCSVEPQASPVLSAIGRAFTGNATLADQTPSTTTQSTSGSALDPSALTHQVIVVLAGLAEFATNIPALIGDLAQLPQSLAAGDITDAHRISGDLNNLASPLIQMASQVDLHLVAKLLAMAAPMDTSGWTAVAAQIVEILARLDIARIATDIGSAQEITWRAAEKLTAGDPLGAGIDLLALLPVAADLATASAAALTGQPASQLTDLATNLTTTNPDTNTALADLARQGNDAASFYGSGIHQTGYTNGVQQVLDWFTDQIDHTR